jgi:hypothetical protein
MDFKELLVKQYRWDAAVVRHMVGQLAEDLSEEELNWQAQPGHHSIWHNIWHMFLSNDYYLSAALQLRSVWEEGGWQDRLDLTPMRRAFDYPGNALEGVVPRFVIADVPDELVDELKAIPLASYLEYVDYLQAKSEERLQQASEERLLERLPWYGGLRRPAYQQASFSHSYRHIGMMEDIRGLIRGPGAGTASI